MSIHIVIDEIKEGYALFNRFTGNTHVLPANFGLILLALSKRSSSNVELLDLYSSHLDTQLAHSDKNLHFQEFITEAIKSGIIIEN